VTYEHPHSSQALFWLERPTRSIGNSEKKLRIEFLKIFAEGVDQGSEKMIGIDNRVTRDELLVNAEMVLR
jgi:hypothetical protein